MDVVQKAQAIASFFLHVMLVYLSTQRLRTKIRPS